MEEGVEAAETNPFAFADEILGYSNRLWKTLAYFSALSVFLVVLVIWLFLGLPTDGNWALPLYVYAAILIIYFPVSVWNSFRLVLPLKHWMDDYFDFAFVVKFELLPAKGDTPTERFLNKVAEIYPRVSRIRTRKPKAVRQAAGFRKNPKVIWDLVIDFNYPGISHSRLIHQYLGRPWYLVMKRFDSGSPVSVEMLKELGEGLKRDLRWQNYEIFHVFVVSTAGFTPEAVTAVRADEAAPLSEHEVELVVETTRGYELPIKD